MRGAVAGAAGTTALNAATFADMAVRGRPPSSTQEKAVSAMAEKAGVDIPGEGEEREARLSGFGSLSGIAVGTGVGAVAGTAAAVLRKAHMPLPLWAGGALTAALAMAVTDTSLARLGVSDPRTWSSSDWLSDALPHLAYGLVTYAAAMGRDGAHA
jgi:hypothetical protein